MDFFSGGAASGIGLPCLVLSSYAVSGAKELCRERIYKISTGLPYQAVVL